MDKLIDKGEIIIYQPDDQSTLLEVRIEEETVWLSQMQMAELFQITRNNVTIHISNIFKERELEKLLTDNILKFILELGKGFAFVGKQFKLEVGGQEFFIDLLFYNYILNRFIVIELKNTDFKPEYVGQISFYLSAINKKIKTTKDKESIGLIICKGKNNKAVLEYSLENVKKPIGIAEYKIMAELGDRLKEVV